MKLRDFSLSVLSQSAATPDPNKFYWMRYNAERRQKISNKATSLYIEKGTLFGVREVPRKDYDQVLLQTGEVFNLSIPESERLMNNSREFKGKTPKIAVAAKTVSAPVVVNKALDPKVAKLSAQITSANARDCLAAAKKIVQMSDFPDRLVRALAKKLVSLGALAEVTNAVRAFKMAKTSKEAEARKKKDVRVVELVKVKQDKPADRFAKQLKAAGYSNAVAIASIPVRSIPKILASLADDAERVAMKQFLISKSTSPKRKAAIEAIPVVTAKPVVKVVADAKPVTRIKLSEVEMPSEEDFTDDDLPYEFRNMSRSSASKLTRKRRPAAEEA